MAVFHRARDWFHGRDSLGEPLADVPRGACCDGLQASGANRNQGAESTLAYLWTELHTPADPLKVIGHLDEPLIAPTEKDRDGYVPNVAYSCGAMIHDGTLYLPFATSDMVTRIAMVSLNALLNRLVK